MRQTAILLVALAATAAGQSGKIIGTVVDDSGAPIQGATVTASLWSSAQPISFVAGKPPAFLPIRANAASGAKGDFEVDGLPAGQYYICIEKPQDSILNPCLWADPPASITVAAGATVSGVSVVAARGATIRVRVQDPRGLLMANPALDDVRIGTFHRAAPFIPALVSGRDPAGKTMTVIVPLGQAASISVSSASFALADQNGSPLAGSAIAVPAAKVAQGGGAAPAITIQVTGTKAHP